MNALSNRSTHLLKLPIAVFSAGFLLLPLAPASAAGGRTLKGTFHSSDGVTGKFVETIDVNGDTTTDKRVLTRKSDGATSTDTTVTTKTSDTSETVVYTHLGYGASAAYTSTKTVTKIKGGATSAGTYTDASGGAGTIKSLDTTAGLTSISATQSTDASNAVTTDLHTQETDADRGLIKDITVAPDGTVTATVSTFTILSDRG
jgi:hypothetical protein